MVSGSRILIRDALRLAAAVCVVSNHKNAKTIENAVLIFIQNLRRRQDTTKPQQLAGLPASTLECARRLLEILPVSNDATAQTPLQALKADLHALTVFFDTRGASCVQPRHNDSQASAQIQQAAQQVTTSIGAFLVWAFEIDMETHACHPEHDLLLPLAATLVSQIMPAVVEGASEHQPTTQTVSTLFDGVLRRLVHQLVTSYPSPAVDTLSAEALGGLLTLKLPTDSIGLLVNVVHSHCDSLARTASAAERLGWLFMVVDLYSAILLYLLNTAPRHSAADKQSETISKCLRMTVYRCLRLLRSMDTADASSLLRQVEAQLESCCGDEDCWQAAVRGFV